jgi:hypothetical protein
VTALLLGRELVLEMNARGAGLDHRLHQLERVQGAAEAGLSVGHDRREPVAVAASFGVLDLIGPKERRVDAANDVGDAIHGIEALVRVHLTRGVGVGGDLPAREVDRLQAGAHLLHRHVAGERAESGHVVLVVEELPQSACTQTRDRVVDVEGTAEPLYVGVRVRAFDALEAAGVKGVVARLFSRGDHGVLSSSVRMA